MLPRVKRKILFGIIFLILFVFVHYVLPHIKFWKSSIDDNSFISSDNDVTRKLFREVAQCSGSPFPGEKLIHLDLKGAPPLVSFYKEFFPFIKKLGATGVLIEYEDMFFYKDELEDIRALNAYQPSDIKKILELADSSNLMVVPLIQTFGHLEFVLKLEKYRHLREVKKYPMMLCPSIHKTWNLLKKMIDQIMEAHPKSKYIHIGCDEVYFLGHCEKCRYVMQDKNWEKNELFLNHVKTIAEYINRAYPGVRPIIWADMFDNISESLVRKSQITELVDLMVWAYVPDVSGYVTDSLLQKLSRLYKSIWIASAFKGTTGVHQTIPDVKYHLNNQISWMRIVSKWKNFIHFKGIAITGWQRYDHFAELCELLPVAIPSLTLALSYVNDCHKGSSEKIFAQKLQCDFPFTFSPNIYNNSNKNCDFPGFPVYKYLNHFYSFTTKVKTFIMFAGGGWFSTYSVLHKFSSPKYVENIFSNWPLKEHLMELFELELNLTIALEEVYDQFTVEEWLTTYMAPLRIRLKAYYIAKEEILKQKVWPRRPLLKDVDGLNKAGKEICFSDRKYGCALLLS